MANGSGIPAAPSMSNPVGEQLRREHEAGPDEQETFEFDPDRNAVAQFEEVVHRAELGFGGDPPHPGAQPDGEEQGADDRGAYPPAVPEPLLVAERSRADGRVGPDVRGEHGFAKISRAGMPRPATKKLSAERPLRETYQAVRDQQDRIGCEDEEMRGHACLTAVGQGGVSAESGSSPGFAEAPGWRCGRESEPPPGGLAMIGSALHAPPA